MSRPERIAESELRAALSGLPGWSLRDGKLHRAFKFADFVEAWRFMSGVALAAEKLDHHPDWSNVYNRVTIELVTHDAGGITTLDLELATRIDQLAEYATKS